MSGTTRSTGRVCVVNFMSLDGVIQSPLAVDEDPSGGFDQGGWVVPYSDDTVNDFMHDATVAAAALLMGRRTHDVMSTAWADADETDEAVATMNRVPKHVVSSREPNPAWPNSHRVAGDLRTAVEKLRDDADGDIVVFGAGTLVRGLAELDLVDEYRILLFPLILGEGKRMWGNQAQPARFVLVDTTTTSSGVAIHTYRRHPDAEPGR